VKHLRFQRLVRHLLTWAALSPALAFGHGGQPQVTALVTPAPATLWALTDNQGVFAVEPGGIRWLCEDAIEPAAGIRGVAVLDPQHWLLSTDSSLWRTDDGGCTFAPLGGELANRRARWLSVHPDHPGEVLVGTDALGQVNDVYRSVDGGQHFTPAGLAVPGQITALHRAPADPEHIYVVHERGVARSDDGGQTFRPFKAGPSALAATPLEFGLLGTSPVDADLLMAVVERFDTLVLRSPDGGNTWDQVAEVPDFPLDLVFDPTGRRALLNGLFVGFLRSEDAGQTFAPAPRSVDRLSGLVRGLDARIWATTQVAFGGPWVVGSSDDFGERWQPALARFQDAPRWQCAVGEATRDCCQHLCPGEPVGAMCMGQAAAAGPSCGGMAAADAGVTPFDAGLRDAQVDAAPFDAAPLDAARPTDAQATDTHVPDAAAPDQGGPARDGGASDAAPPAATAGGEGCRAVPGR